MVPATISRLSILPRASDHVEFVFLRKYLGLEAFLSQTFI
jgi:hypothetical protein